MIPVVTPKILKLLFPQLIWEIPTTEKIIYLTFDDGPEPDVTPQVLALLRKYSACATFFCTGEKIKKYPSITSKIRDDGHLIGNHGYQHLSGWSSIFKDYTENFLKSETQYHCNLFRPPYGRITPKQIKFISEKADIVLWSIMSKDFQHKTTTAKCINNVLQNAYPGAIVVFHDTPMASDTLLKSLPAILEGLQEKGYKFDAL